MGACKIQTEIAMSDEEIFEKLSFLSPKLINHLDNDNVKEALIEVERAARRMVATAYKSSNQHNDYISYDVGTYWVKEMRDALLNLQQWCAYYEESIDQDAVNEHSHSSEE